MEMRQDDFSTICSRCEIICCKGARPPLSSERIRIIDENLKRTGSKLDSWYCREKYNFPKETSFGCIFLSAEKRCMIQSFKPETCVAGPITFDVDLKRETIEFYLKKEQICPLAGALFRDKSRLRKHLMSAKKEIKNLVSKLSKKDLLAILEIEEPDTFKIDEDSLE